MSFRRGKEIRRKLMLFPLMDVFFIMLIFFLAIAAIKFQQPGWGKQIESKSVYTPTERRGETHVLIQLNADETFTWIDSECHQIIRNQGLDALDSLLTHPLDELPSKLEDYCALARICAAGLINVAIRCPNEMDYGAFWEVQETVREVIGGKEEREGEDAEESSRFAVDISILAGSLRDIERSSAMADTVYVDFSR